MIISRDQRKALKRVYDRDHSVAPSYKSFRKTVHDGSGCIMVFWKNMWLGIEPDGYVHS
jgi:hypothetical protein